MLIGKEISRYIKIWKDLQKDYPTTRYSDKFVQFVENKLVPFINKNYKTDKTKYIIGQSLGGLLTTEILLKTLELFTHYFIISQVFCGMIKVF